METTEEFWARCRGALAPEARERGYTERRLGNTPAMVGLLLDLIVSGAKRGTFSLPEKLERDGTLPTPGDLVVLTRADGHAGCLIEIEACEVLPFDQIGPKDLEIEGPGARDLRAWRKIHRKYWTPILDSWGQTLAPDQPVLMQRFRLVAVALDSR